MIPDFKRRNVKKNKARLWPQSPITPQMMTRHLAAAHGGKRSPEPKAGEYGSRFFIHIENFKGNSQINDSTITDSFLRLKDEWKTDLMELIREGPDITTECPWCGAENGFNSVVIGIVISGGHSIPDEMFICDSCMEPMGRHGLWIRSALRNTSGYPTDAIRDMVGMFAYPIKDMEGNLHGMPFHKGLYKNANWRQSEHWGKTVGRIDAKSVRAFATGESVFDSESDMNRYLYMEATGEKGEGYIVRPYRDIPIDEHLRLLGVAWKRKYIYAGLVRHADMARRRGKNVQAYYSLLIRPTAKHKKYIVIRQTQSPLAYEWMEKLE